MASVEMQKSSETVEKVEDRRVDVDDEEKMKKNRESIEKKKTKKSKKKTSFMPKFGCFRSENDYPTVERSDSHGNFDTVSTSAGANRLPTHLVIMVNGIIGRLVCDLVFLTSLMITRM
ncbi:hypothetical protein U1Q18_005388 [Sarracenia purpurea var. burkii]